MGWQWGHGRAQSGNAEHVLTAPCKCHVPALDWARRGTEKRGGRKEEQHHITAR